MSVFLGWLRWSEVGCVIVLFVLNKFLSFVECLCLFFFLIYRISPARFMVIISRSSDFSINWCRTLLGVQVKAVYPMCDSIPPFLIQPDYSPRLLITILAFRSGAMDPFGMEFRFGFPAPGATSRS